MQWFQKNHIFELQLQHFLKSFQLYFGYLLWRKNVNEIAWLAFLKLKQHFGIFSSNTAAVAQDFQVRISHK